MFKAHVALKRKKKKKIKKNFCNESIKGQMYPILITSFILSSILITYVVGSLKEFIGRSMADY